MIYPPNYADFIPANRIFDFDVMAAIGLLRYGLKFQRREIQILFIGRNIEISEGEVSELSFEFLLRFYLLHRNRASRLRELLESNPGKVFHADGTQDDGSDVVFTVMEGLTGIVLDSFLIPNEGKNELVPVLQQVKERYGTPDVCVRDLSTQLRDAMAIVFPGVPQQGCHRHFVTDLGEMLFEHRYVDLRQAVLDTGVLARMSDYRKRMSSPIDGNLLEHSVRLWAQLVVEYVQEPRTGTSHFPLELPYLECIRRAHASQHLLLNLTHILSDRMTSFQTLYELGDLLECIQKDESINTRYPVVDQIDKWFERIRVVLRQSRQHMSMKTPGPRIPTDQIKDEFISELQKVRDEAAWLGGQYPAIAATMTRYCERHMDELFVKVLAKDGTELPFRRENNLEESMHRRSRMGIRRRTGRGNTNLEMAHHGPLLAVFQNIVNPVYIAQVLGDIQSLPVALKSIPDEDVKELRIKLQNGRKGCTLPVKDGDRLKCLEGLIGILKERSSNEKSLLEGWTIKVAGGVLTEF